MSQLATTYVGFHDGRRIWLCRWDGRSIKLVSRNEFPDTPFMTMHCDWHDGAFHGGRFSPDGVWARVFSLDAKCESMTLNQLARLSWLKGVQ